MIAAIDPGMKGAIAILYSQAKLYVYDMPVLGKEVNGAAVADIFREFPPGMVLIEATNSFGMGRQSAYNFGQGVGTIKGVMATLAISYQAVAPAKWKRHFALSRDKDASRAAATRLFPGNASDFLRKKDDGRAEAALLALYGLSQQPEMGERNVEAG